MQTLLRQEAETIKKEGQRIDPNFGVSATWNIEAVLVNQCPGTTAKPWNGTIRFKIESRTREPDGSTTRIASRRSSTTPSTPPRVAASRVDGGCR